MKWILFLATFALAIIRFDAFVSVTPRPENSAPLSYDNVRYEITTTANETRQFVYDSDLPDRFQWSHNYGYCGGL